jgi:hypothetical protein
LLLVARLVLGVQKCKGDEDDPFEDLEAMPQEDEAGLRAKLEKLFEYFGVTIAELTQKNMLSWAAEMPSYFKKFMVCACKLHKN